MRLLFCNHMANRQAVALVTYIITALYEIVNAARRLYTPIYILLRDSSKCDTLLNDKGNKRRFAELPERG